jgi:hypothetical protein
MNLDHSAGRRDLPEQNEELKALEFIRPRRIWKWWHGIAAKFRSTDTVCIVRFNSAQTWKGRTGARNCDPPPAVVLHLVDADSMASATLICI